MTEQEMKEEMLNWNKVKLRDEAWFQNERAEKAEKRIKVLEARILKMRELLSPLKSLIWQ
jgi:hypothetical protein